MRSGDGLPRGRPRLQLFCDRLALSKYLWGVPFPLPDVFIDLNKENQPIRLPGLKAGAGLPSPGPAGFASTAKGGGKAGAGVCSGLILSGAFYPDLKIGVWRRRTYQRRSLQEAFWGEETGRSLRSGQESVQPERELGRSDGRHDARPRCRHDREPRRICLRVLNEHARRQRIQASPSGSTLSSPATDFRRTNGDA